jgi:hypothetical protein
LAPSAIDQIMDELKAVNLATVMIDTSNHKNLKIVLILILYFDPKIGVQIKVLEFTNLKEETSDILSFYIMEILTKINYLTKLLNLPVTTIILISEMLQGEEQKMFLRF